MKDIAIVGRVTQMTEKRFENRLDKSNVKFNTLNPVWDNEKEDALNVFEMIDLLNELNDENEQLKKENIKLKNRNAYLDQHYGERTRKYFDGIEEWASGGH